MPHSREVRTHAHEIKFLIDAEAAARVRSWARAHLESDPHGSGPFGDEYRTTSVYFDTDDYAVFHRRGSFGRSKYRIRRYGDDDAVFLERKLREPAVLAKRRTRTGLTSLAMQLAAPDPTWPGHWFHRRIVARQLQPVCQVTYHRMARSLPRSAEYARLTLDSDLRATRATDARFAVRGGIPIVDGRAILELKYRGLAPLLFKYLLEELRLTPQTASKYRLGVAAIGGVALEAPQARYA